MHPCVEIFLLCYFLYRFSSFARICFSLVSLSIILAKRLIASLKHYKRILEIWLQLIFSNPGVRSSAIWWCMWKWIGIPLPASEISLVPNSPPHYLPVYHVPEIGVLTGTYFAESQVSNCLRLYLRIKWDNYLCNVTVCRFQLRLSK